MEKWEDLLFGVRRSVRYHMRRRRFFDNTHKIAMILTSLGGSATIVSLLGEFGKAWTIGFAAFVAIFSIVDLIFATDKYARLHDDLARQFIEIEKEMISIPAPDEENLSTMTSRRLL